MKLMNNFIQAAINLGEEGMARVSCTNWGTAKLWVMARAKWSRTILHVMAAMSSLGWYRMVLETVKEVGYMLMEDQKPRARWRQLQAQVALGTELYLKKAQETRDLLTKEVIQGGITKRIPAMKMGSELTRNIFLEVGRLEEKLKKDLGPGPVSAVKRVLDLRLVPGRPGRNSRCGECRIFHPQAAGCRGQGVQAVEGDLGGREAMN
jgi:hypothetical protein